MATLRVICFAALATSLLASSAYAQSATKPLNLTVPPNKGFPVANAATTTPAKIVPASTTTPTSTTPTTTNMAPGVYYGDHSGETAAGEDANNPDESCNDATVNKPQIHGDVSTGVVAGNHFSGNYQAATVNVTKPLGTCEHPKGSLSITAHVSQGHFGYHGSH